jgi:hypothetical protein
MSELSSEQAKQIVRSYPEQGGGRGGSSRSHL